MDALRTEHVQQIEATISTSARRMLGFMGSAALSDLDVRFTRGPGESVPERFRLNYLEHGLELAEPRTWAQGSRARLWWGSSRRFASLARPQGVCSSRSQRCISTRRRSATSIDF